ncbi:unnamed protein product, partial [Choristocarpus tenellus]
MSGSLKGKVAVVTGASRGIGKGIALALGEEGCIVYLTGRSSGGRTTDEELGGTVEQTVEDIRAAGGHGVAVLCDHADDTQATLFERVESEQGRLDLLVNNAFCLGPGEQLTVKFWEQG